MEGYKLFKEAVEAASAAAVQWKYVGDGSIFTKQELLDMADVFDEKFPIGGWNYFVTFPNGEISLLATEDNQIERLYLPVKDTDSTKAAEEPARPKFCSGCGNRLEGAAKFCPKCGKKI